MSKRRSNPRWSHCCGAVATSRSTTSHLESLHLHHDGYSGFEYATPLDGLTALTSLRGIGGPLPALPAGLRTLEWVAGGSAAPAAGSRYIWTPPSATTDLLHQGQRAPAGFAALQHRLQSLPRLQHLRVWHRGCGCPELVAQLLHSLQPSLQTLEVEFDSGKSAARRLPLDLSRDFVSQRLPQHMHLDEWVLGSTTDFLDVTRQAVRLALSFCMCHPNVDCSTMLGVVTIPSSLVSEYFGAGCFSEWSRTQRR